MKTLEVTGPFPGAHELPNKPGRPAAKHQKSPGGNSGGAKRTSYMPRLSGRQLGDQQKEDREITEANRMVLLLLNGKRKFVRQSDYRAGVY